MEDESILKKIYEELKKEVEKEETKKNLDLDEKEMQEETMNELIKEYEEKRDKLKNEIRELKKKEIKEKQRKKLARYYKSFYHDDLSISNEGYSRDEEKKKQEQLEEIENVLKLLNGESGFEKKITGDIKDHKSL